MNTPRTLCLLLGFTLAGCGPGRGDVSGKVYYGDKPVVWGSVVAVGADKRPRVGAIASDGSFTITGLPAGDVRLAVHSPEPRGASRAEIDERARMPKPGLEDLSKDPPIDPKLWFKLPVRYSKLEESGLSAVVQSGTVTGFDIRLEVEADRKK